MDRPGMYSAALNLKMSLCLFLFFAFSALLICYSHPVNIVPQHVFVCVLEGGFV